MIAGKICLRLFSLFLKTHNIHFSSSTIKWHSFHWWSLNTFPSPYIFKLFETVAPVNYHFNISLVSSQFSDWVWIKYGQHICLSHYAQIVCNGQQLATMKILIITWQNHLSFSAYWNRPAIFLSHMVWIFPCNSRSPGARQYYLIN